MNKTIGRIYFEYKYSDTDPKVSITLHRDSTLEEAIEAFEHFLRAAGYSFDGHLTLLDDAESK